MSSRGAYAKPLHSGQPTGGPDRPFVRRINSHYQALGLLSTPLSSVQVPCRERASSALPERLAGRMAAAPDEWTIEPPRPPHHRQPGAFAGDVAERGPYNPTLLAMPKELAFSQE